MNDFYILINTCPEASMGKKHKFSEEELKKLIQKIVTEMKNYRPKKQNKHPYFNSKTIQV